jgi:aldehyde dehydrogenase (NAD+)
MVNQAHFNRVTGLIDPAKVVSGGLTDRDDLYIEPTVMDGVTEQDPVMGEEVFGPLMSVIGFTDLDRLTESMKRKPAPLMLYIFTGNTWKAKQMMKTIPSGGGMINDVVLQFINMDSPFGGVGESGMGSYHGRDGFESFSHKKTVMNKRNWFDLFLKYPPYRDITLPVYRAVLGRSLRNLFR